MKKIELIFIIPCLLVVFSACQKDNFPPPDATIYGNLTDSETGGKLELSQAGSNSNVRMLVNDPAKYPSPAPFDLTTFGDGTYRNTMIFADTYTVYPLAASGPWMVLPGDTVSTTIAHNSTTELNFKVAPYFRIAASVVDSTVTFTITKSAANTTASNLTTSNNLLILINNTAIVNENVSSNTAGVYTNQFRYTVTNSVLGVPQIKVIPFSKTHLAKGDYYFRVAVVGNGQNGKWNYSPVVKATVH